MYWTLCWLYRVQQPMQSYTKCLKKHLSGVSKFSFSLGLLFNFFCISVIRLSVKFSKLDFWVMYLLISLFAFSMDPFCHEE